MVVVACFFSSFVKLACSPLSYSCVKAILIRFIVLRDIVSLFFISRMLRQSRSEVCPMHRHCSVSLKLMHIVFIQHMIVFLKRTALRVRMLRWGIYSIKCLIGWLFRLLHWRLLLTIRILCLHRAHSKFLFSKDILLSHHRGWYDLWFPIYFFVRDAAELVEILFHRNMLFPHLCLEPIFIHSNTCFFFYYRKGCGGYSRSSCQFPINVFLEYP